jgi:hypothetical protein
MRSAISIPFFNSLEQKRNLADRAVAQFAYAASSVTFPAAKIQSNTHAGFAEFVGERGVNHCASNHHATNAQCREGLSVVVTRFFLRGQTTLQRADHSKK